MTPKPGASIGHPISENLTGVCVIGAPFSHGQTLSGVNAGPAVLRDNGLASVIKSLGWAYTDLGDLAVPDAHKDVNLSEHGLLSSPVLSPPTRASSRDDGSVLSTDCQSLRAPMNGIYDDSEIINCEVVGRCCSSVANATSSAAARHQFVLTIGGDHSIAAGSIGGLLTVYPDLVVIWVDAHGDINVPETSPSKLYHGMPVAHLLGWFKKEAPGFEWMSRVPKLSPSNVAFIGLRDIDEGERQLINSSEVHAYSMHSIDRIGIGETIKRALHAIDPEGIRPIHLSFDIDGCDPSIAPGTGTKARGGLNYREAHYICETVFETGRLVSMDLVEINPDLDRLDEYYHGDNPVIPSSATKTVRLGLDLIGSALGKVIL